MRRPNSCFYSNLFFGVAAICATSPSAWAQTSPKTHFNIAGQDLSKALTEVGQQSRREILFSADLARGLRSAAVVGDFTLDGALDRLLAGTGLEHRAAASGSIIITRQGPASAAPSPVRAPAVDPTPPPSPEAIETVVVTGQTSVDRPRGQIKHDALGIVDSVTARDLEKTVDTNLAEALDRIPGVSADRFYGTSNAGYVTIRGFDSRYNSVDIDGNPIWFSSQNNRGHQIGVFPSAIINEASVYKTVTPDQDANSIGGHISMRTLRAFDGGGAPYISLGSQIGAYDQNSHEDSGPSGRIYGVGKTTFGEDHAFGVVLGFNYQRTRNSDVYGGVDTYSQVGGADLVNANVYSDSAYDKQIDTTALYGKLEAHITDKLYSFLSFNYFDDQQRLYLQRVGTNISAAKTTGFSDGEANFTGATAYTKEYDYDISRKAKVVGGGVDYRLGAKGVITLRGNYTDFTNDITTLYPETFDLAGLSGRYDLNGALPTVTFANPALYDNAAAWVNRNSTASYDRGQFLNDKVYALRADYNYNTFATARGLGLSVGAAWTRLDRDYTQTQSNYLLPKGSTLLLSQVADPGATMAANQAVKMNWNAFWSYIRTNGIVTYSNEATTDYHLVEDVSAAYAALYFAGDNYRLLAGVRYEDTQFTDETGAVVKGVNVPDNHSRNYGNVLPNLQASYDILHDLRVRAAFTKTLARPDFSDFAAGQTTTLDTNGNPVVSGSNPNANPRISTNDDLSLEYYFHNGFASLALFRKVLEHETFTQQTQVLNSAGQVVLTEQVPFNNGKGRMNGLEASLVDSRLDFLPGLLAGLGVNANLSLLDGRYDVVLTNGTRRTLGALRNQPRILGNLGVSYAIGPFDADVTWHARGRSLTTTIGATAAGDIWIRSNNQVDFKAGVHLTPQLKLSFEARNLTNDDWKQVTGATGAVYNSVGAGRSYFADIAFKY